jgi:AraC-like DNA-binding protein
MVPSLAKEAMEGPCYLSHKQLDRYPFFWHYHSECELFVPLAGRGECLVGDFLGEYHPGQAFYLPPMLPHCFHTLESGRRRHPQESYVLFFGRESELYRALTQTADLDSLAHRWPGGVRLTPADTSVIAEALRKMSASAGLARVGAFVDVLAALFACQDGEPLAHPATPPQAPVEHAAQRMNAIGSYLHRHCTQEVLLADVARAAEMSVPSLCRFFKRRLGRVCRLLRETARPITEIALSSGYLTVSHFNRSFRAAKGMSPRDYRKQCRAA